MAVFHNKLLHMHNYIAELTGVRFTVTYSLAFLLNELLDCGINETDMCTYVPLY